MFMNHDWWEPTSNDLKCVLDMHRGEDLWSTHSHTNAVMHVKFVNTFSGHRDANQIESGLHQVSCTPCCGRFLFFLLYR